MHFETLHKIYHQNQEKNNLYAFGLPLAGVHMKQQKLANFFVCSGKIL